MSDLNALLIFAKVMEAGSFTEAARRLRMPVSTVSRRVAELENDLRVGLIERSTRSMRLTTTGEAVLLHAQSIALNSDAVAGIVAESVNSVSGTLRLSAPPSMAEPILAPLLQAFRATCPDVRVHVLVTDRQVNQIAEAVDISFHIGQLKDSSMTCRKVFEFRCRLVASPEYLALAKAPESPSDLQGHCLLAFQLPGTDACWELCLADRGDSQAVRFEPQVGMNDYAGIAALLVSGMGIGALPPVLASHLIASERLIEVLPDWRLPVERLSLVHMANRHPSKIVRLFKDTAAQLMPLLFEQSMVWPHSPGALKDSSQG